MPSAKLNERCAPVGEDGSEKKSRPISPCFIFKIVSFSGVMLGNSVWVSSKVVILLEDVIRNVCIQDWVQIYDGDDSRGSDTFSS
jgi:hypothetical protein